MTITAIKIRGMDKLLTLDDVAEIIGKPTRWVRDKLIKTSVLPSVKFGGNSIRIRPADLEKMLARGTTGYTHAQPSGAYRRIS